MLALPFVLASMGSGAVNDFYDSDKDRINRPYRPVPSGILSRFVCSPYGSFLMGAAFPWAHAGADAATAALYCSAVAGWSCLQHCRVTSDRSKKCMDRRVVCYSGDVLASSTGYPSFFLWQFWSTSQAEKY